MKKIEKIIYLKENHFSEWVKERSISLEEISQSQKMFCSCGKLATGMHETYCRKFNAQVDTLTLKKLNHLLKKQKV